LVSVLLLAGCGGGQSRDAPTVSVSATDLGTLGGTNSVAHAINDAGQIVGSARTAQDLPHAVLWQDGKLRDLGTGDGVASRAHDINDRGEVVGSFDVNVGDSHYSHAFAWENGEMRRLGTPGETESEANAINERGQIVGMWNGRAALWEDGKPTLLPSRWRGYATDINERGDIVGVAKLPDGHRHAVLWQNGRLRDLTPEATIAAALAINNRGEIVGVKDVIGECHQHTSRAFLWWRGKIRILGTLGGSSSSASAINNQGQILGQADTSRATRDCDKVASDEYIDPRPHAFLWRNGKLFDLGPLVSGLGGAEAMNDYGQIVGSLMLGSSVDHAFLWTTKNG
jgi:probable HAF family extracellular repeat protein